MRKLQKVNLKKKSLDELAGEMQVINRKEQKQHVGGAWSNFEDKCLANYMYCGGDMALSSFDFQDIANAASYAPTVSSRWVQKNGCWYNVQVKNFYNNDNYNAALGHATMIYDSCGNAVGFYDMYDFDSGEEHRTSVPNLLGSLAQNMGCSYAIRYGIQL